MVRWGKVRMFLASLVLTAAVTVVVPAGLSMGLALAGVLIAILLTAAVFPATLAMVGDVASTSESLGATTGLIGLSNLIGSMVAPWAFGALLDAFETAPGATGTWPATRCSPASRSPAPPPPVRTWWSSAGRPSHRSGAPEIRRPSSPCTSRMTSYSMQHVN